MAAVRDAYGRDLDEIITDVPEIREMILGYLEEISPELKEKLVFIRTNFFRFISCIAWKPHWMRSRKKKYG